MCRSAVRGVTLTFTVLLGVLPLLQAAAQSPSSSSPPSVSLSSLVDQTVALFPEFEGDVAEAQGRSVTLSVGRRGGARVGLVVNIVHEGREIRHPKTGQVLGREEQPVGRAVITQVAEGYSVARVDADGAQVGDHVRTVGKVRLALVTIGSTGVRPGTIEAASGEVYESLNRNGRVQPVLSEQVAVWLSEQKIDGEDFLRGRGVREAIEQFKLDHILAMYFKQVGRRPFLEARLFSAGRPDPVLTTAFFVPQASRTAETGRYSAADRQPSRPDKPQRSFLVRMLAGLLGMDPEGGYSGSDSIPLKEVARVAFTVISMDVAVAPSDKIPRVVLTDGEKIWVYKLQNRVLEGDWTYSARSLGRIISVQFADLDGDGVLEVVANRFDTKIGMNSLIAGLKNGKPTALVDNIDSFLVAVDDRGAGVKQTLWLQRYSPLKFFDAGAADQYALRDGALVRERTVLVPSSFRATGATTSNVMGKDTRSLVFIDEQNRLRIASGSEELWRSSSMVGGGVRKVEVVRELERGGRSYYYQMEPTPLAVDLDGDGVEEIIVPQNQLDTGVLGVVFRGSAGVRFQQVNSGFEGVVAGLGAIPGEDGPPTLIAAVVRHTNFLKVSGETQIIMTTAE